VKWACEEDVELREVVRGGWIWWEEIVWWETGLVESTMVGGEATKGARVLTRVSPLM
jgi:hypothetical protein